MKPVSVIIIGAGCMGTIYANIMAKMPERYKIVGVAEPVKSRRENIQKLFDIPADACFTSWEEILDRPKMADMALIATNDNMHFHPAMKAISLGYHMLLEKPIAQTPQECAQIAQAAKEKGVCVLVCHQMRYSPFYLKVKKLLKEGVVGDVMTVINTETAGNLRQIHSYVRGNWHSEEETTPMLLAKSSHDIDILQWLLEKPCRKVQSFGELTHYTKKYAPEGAPVRCIDGGCPVADTCPYECKKLYLEDPNNTLLRFDVAKDIAAGSVPNDEEVMRGLQTTDYGLCVYQANNDVVDHQVVNMEFDGGTTVSFTMCGFGAAGRYIRVLGTKGELYANRFDDEIKIYSFADRAWRNVPVLEPGEEIQGGHGGGDHGLMTELYDYVTGCYTGISAADIGTSMRNHLVCFAAEQSRRTDTVVDMDEYMDRLGISNTY